MRKRDDELAQQAEREKTAAPASAGVSGGETACVRERDAGNVKPKKSKTLSIKSVVLTNSWRIQSPGDVDAYVGALKKELLKKLDDDTIINIEF